MQLYNMHQLLFSDGRGWKESLKLLEILLSSRSINSYSVMEPPLYLYAACNCSELKKYTRKAWLLSYPLETGKAEHGQKGYFHNHAFKT